MEAAPEGERDFVGVREIAALIRTIRDEHPHPIFLNADHTHSLPRAEEAARAGFDQIIFDGSALSFEENVQQTRRALDDDRRIDGPHRPLRLLEHARSFGPDRADHRHGCHR